MIKNLVLVLITLINLKQASAQQYGSFKDPRDGKVYKTVKIGEQVWMAEDLITSHFLNGDDIFSPSGSGNFYKETENRLPAWCEASLRNSKLYNGYAIVDNRKLCPVDWHIPTMSDWNKLIKFLGGSAIAGRKMKSKSGWGTIKEGGPQTIICQNCKSWSDDYKRMVPCHTCKGNRFIIKNIPTVEKSLNGNNQSGFNVMPNGELDCYIILPRMFPRILTTYWSSELASDYSRTFYQGIFLGTGDELSNVSIKNTDGASVRCVKN
jgi:uncharacterized protein (TIGR02145 family)